MGRGGQENKASGGNLLYGPRILHPRKAEPEEAAPIILTDADIYDALKDPGVVAQMRKMYPLPRLMSFPDRGNGFVLADTETLVAAPTMKEFSGHVGVGCENGEPVFVGFTHYGPAGRGSSQGTVEYKGENLRDACAAVNKKIAAKQKTSARSSYRTRSGGTVSLVYSTIKDSLLSSLQANDAK
jgi:hypothetical protein